MDAESDKTKGEGCNFIISDRESEFAAIDGNLPVRYHCLENPSLSDHDLYITEHRSYFSEKTVGRQCSHRENSEYPNHHQMFQYIFQGKYGHGQPFFFRRQRNSRPYSEFKIFF